MNISSGIITIEYNNKLKRELMKGIWQHKVKKTANANKTLEKAICINNDYIPIHHNINNNIVL